MKKALILVLLLGTAAEAEDIDTKPLMAPVLKLVAAINHPGPTPPAVFTKDAVVIDDFAPYRWSGTGNADQWFGALVGSDEASRKAFAETESKLAVKAPKFARITEDSAYMVVPASFDFLDGGKKIHQTGQWIISEQKLGGAWMISGHAYAIISETQAKTP